MDCIIRVKVVINIVMGDKKLLEEMGYRISLTRKHLKMTQEELAERMEVSVQMISNLELGKKAIRPENLVKLCTVLDVSADYILMGRFSERERSSMTDSFMKLNDECRELIDELIKHLK